MHRRTFIKNTSLATASVSLGTSAFAAPKNKNKLPYWKGFNLTDFFTPNPNNQRRVTKEEHFKWIVTGVLILSGSLLLILFI